MSSKTCIIEVLANARIRYEFPSESGVTVIEGSKGCALGGDDPVMMQLGNRGFWITLDDGSRVPISRYARVEVL